MGIWDVLKKKLANEGDRHHSSFEEHIGKNVYEIASFDVNNASLAEKILYFLDNRSQGEQIQLADKLLREGPFEASIQMYSALIQKYPEERDRYENGIGSAYLKLGDFYKALEYYITARSHGMHPDITDKHIWDACFKQFKQTGDIFYVEKYFDHTDNGKYTAQANELLRNAGKEVAATQPVSVAPIVENIVVETPISIESTPQEEVYEIQQQLTEDEIFDESQNLEDVAKKDKQSDENQFSLFGFGEQSESTDKSENPTGNIPAVNDNPIEDTTDADFFELSTEFHEDNIDMPVEEAPNMLMALDYHIDRFFNNEDVVVWKDKRSDEQRIDIFHIKPNEERNYNLLLTFGMSRQPMNVPAGFEQFSYGELAIILPVDWDLSSEGLKDPNNYWPVLWLKNLARIPVQDNSWLCYGHSIPHGNPSKQIADTEFEGVVIMDSATLPEEFQEMKLGDDALYIYTVIPVYPEEMEYKIKNDINSLRNAFADARIPDIIWVDRPTSVSDDML